MEIKLTCSPETDITVANGPDGRPVITLKPRFYSRQGLASLLYATSNFDANDRESEQYMLGLGLTTGRLVLRSSKEIVPKFMSGKADEDDTDEEDEDEKEDKK